MPNQPSPERSRATRITTLPAFTPVPREKDRSNGWKPEIQRAFIEALAETGSVKSAANRVNRAEVGAYLLRRHPQADGFRRAWDAALDIGMRRIEDVAMDRALHGVEVPVYSYGKLIGTRTIYNDRLLMFMLRNRAPERFAAGGRGLRHGEGAKAENAVDQMKLNRLKKQWCKEWDDEAAARLSTAADESAAFMDQQIARARESWLERMSPKTRAAFDALIEAQREDDEARWAKERDREHPLLKNANVIRSSSGPNPLQLPVVCTPISARTGKRTHPAPWDREEVPDAGEVAGEDAGEDAGEEGV